MFTGLIQSIGKLSGIERRGNGSRLTVEHKPWTEPLTPGESVAVQGACLTVTDFRPGSFECDVLRETLDRTTLGKLARGTMLNLERALKPADRIGGHFVTGHVDGAGTVAQLKQESQDWLLEIGCASDLLACICVKCSVALDGVSLTVVAVTAKAFGVRLIPFSWANTTLRNLRHGSPVNIETDILEKYVRQRSVSGHSASGHEGSVTTDHLRDAGFIL